MVTRHVHLEILTRLLALDRPIAELAEMARLLPWDSEVELAEVGREALVSILTRYRRGEISARDVEAWANLVEGREDLAFTRESAAIVHHLANPILDGALTEDSAAQLIERATAD